MESFFFLNYLYQSYRIEYQCKFEEHKMSYWNTSENPIFYLSYISKWRRINPNSDSGSDMWLMYLSKYGTF